MFAASTLSAATLLVGVTAWRRSAVYATFLAVVLGIHLAAGIAIHGRLEAWGLGQPAWVGPVVELLHAWGAASCLAMSAAMVGAPRLRGIAWRWLVVVPGSVWSAGTLLAVPWLAVSGVLAWIVPVPSLGWAAHAVALTGVWTSQVPRREVVRLSLGGPSDPADGPVRRVEVVRRRVGALPSGPLPGVLRVVQITDPHLGPFQSEASLRALCARAVAAEPDLVLLTGDYFTMEGAGTPEALGRALAPLRALEGRTFACLGNHDHESPDAVTQGLAAAGVRLLVDSAVRVDTRLGPVQLVGLDHRWPRGRRPPRALADVDTGDVGEHARVLRAIPRPAGVPRIVLLHDPGAFRVLPPGEADLVLSGHTHGGHVGLVALGGRWTAIHGLTGMPDHGAWSRGRDRLYVHRASGHYGFPLRIGVPIEESVLEIEGLPAPPAV
jgi:predicted MPP superfamily phosphohydrolase